MEIPSTKEGETTRAFRVLLDHFDSLPIRFKLTIVDSLTALVSHSDDRSIIDFFASCKQLCDRGRTIIAVGPFLRLRRPDVDSYPFPV